MRGHDSGAYDESIIYSFYPHIFFSIMHVFMILISILMCFSFMFAFKAKYKEIEQTWKKNTK